MGNTEHKSARKLSTIQDINTKQSIDNKIKECQSECAKSYADFVLCASNGITNQNPCMYFCVRKYGDPTLEGEFFGYCEEKSWQKEAIQDEKREEQLQLMKQVGRNPYKEDYRLISDRKDIHQPID